MTLSKLVLRLDYVRKTGQHKIASTSIQTCDDLLTVNLNVVNEKQN